MPSKRSGIMNEPLVSFIIPYFNSGETIQETINSILNQSYKNFDIWIVNDGSTDPFSIQKLKDFEENDKIYIIHQENAGPSVARNLAIQQCKAEFIVPLDADDLIESRSINDSINIFNNPQIGVVYGDIQYFGEERTHKIQSDFILERQLIMNQIAVTALIRKAVYNQVGYYDEFLSKPGLEDWEFWLRVGQSSWKFVKLNTIFFKARLINSSRTYQVANKNIDIIKDYVYKKHAILIMKTFHDLYYQKKQLLETPDYKIGNTVMAPYRYLKKKFFKNG